MTAVKKVVPVGKNSPAVKAVPHLITKPMEIIGRDVLIKCPTLEQLVALEEIYDAMSKAQDSEQSYLETKILFNQYYRMITALLARVEDKEWLAEGRVEGYVTLRNPEIAQIPIKVLKMFKPEIEAMASENGNRADRRAAARKKA